MWKASTVGVSHFHTSSIWNAKLGKVMKKVLGQTSKKRRNYVESAILPTPEMFSKGNDHGGSTGSPRRVAVLNKLFMKNITDIMATGEYASDFYKHGIEINKVKIAPDYKTLNVFWVAKGTEVDEEIENILKKNAGFLRHELSTLRVMGIVPIIQFVKDKQQAILVEIDKRLGEADFGDDYEPPDPSAKLKTEFELFTSIPSNFKEKIRELEEETADDIIEVEFPPMPQNVFGLDHAEILNRLKRNLKKSKALHRLDNTEIESVQTINENPVEYSSSKEQREAFKNFLAQREALRIKVKKGSRKYFPDLEYMKEEIEQRQKHYFDDLEICNDEEEYYSDYDDEEIKEK